VSVDGIRAKETNYKKLTQVCYDIRAILFVILRTERTSSPEALSFVASESDSKVIFMGHEIVKLL
jgi:hypothetical protein